MVIVIVIIIVILINITDRVILEKSSGGEFKEGIQAAWSTPIHDVK